MSHSSDDEYFARREQESLHASSAAHDVCARRAHAKLAIAYGNKRVTAGVATLKIGTIAESRPAEPFPHDLGQRPLRTVPLWVPAGA